MTGVVPIADVLLQLDGVLGSGVVDALPKPVSTTGAVFYGAWALFGAGAVKKGRDFLRRSRSDPVDAAIEGGSATKGTTTVGKTLNPSQSLSKGDHAAFVIPGVVPLSKGVRQVSHNEIHALELGAVIGFAASWLASIGRQSVAVSLVTLFVAGALGYKRYRTKAFKTVRLEPWYAVMALGFGATVGYVFFNPGIAEVGGSLPV